jgi:polyisoprenoid-binding protein YceI
MAPLLLAALLAAAPEGPRTFDVEPAGSVLRYRVVHRFHDVVGTATRLEGKAELQPDGSVRAMVRAPVASFDSGESNRDHHMREAVDAARFPFVVFKGVARLGGDLLAAAERGTPVELVMDGEVELRGTRRPVTVPLRVELGPGGSGRVRGSFEVSLESFGVERPSLLFVKIRDACRIELDLALRPAAG